MVAHEGGEIAGGAPVINSLEAGAGCVKRAGRAYVTAFPTARLALTGCSQTPRRATKSRGGYMAKRESLVADRQTLETAREYKAELCARMFANAQGARARGSSAGQQPSPLSVLPPHHNIVGFGYGAKVSYGAAGAVIENELAVRVYVRAKLPAAQLPSGIKVPAKINGLPTDVIPVGDITPLARPVMCGASVGHQAVNAGTLGCLVRRSGDQGGDRYILSNNHVLARANKGKRGDQILEPGAQDGGTVPIAELSDFEKLDFGGTNHIDAAIARVLDPGDVLPEIYDIGIVEPDLKTAVLYQSVRKYGRTTKHTVGVVMDIAADIWVWYGSDSAPFENQLAVEGVSGDFSDHGDSGSLVVDAVERRAVALLFSGGRGITYANPIEPVLARFGAEIISTP